MKSSRQMLRRFARLGADLTCDLVRLFLLLMLV